MTVYTNKQLQLLRKWQRGEMARLNILEGSIRSGKTWISLVLWAFWVGTMPADKAYLMAAKTITSLKRNCLDLLIDLVGESNFQYSIGQKEGSLFGRKVYLEGVNDLRAESKIRGMTLQGAYCDELTLFTEDFFEMLLSRLSEPGAKLIGTTNPDNPNHWLMQKFIKRQDELDMLVMKFLIEENTFLSPDFIESQKKEHTGVFFERFILGNWVIAEGLIYPNFDYEKHVLKTAPRQYSRYQISLDYGTQNPFSMGLWGEFRGMWIRIKEYYHDGRKDGQKTDAEYYADLCGFAGNLPVDWVIIDPSAASFITLVRKESRFRVKPADNAVLDGIRNVATALQMGIIKFNDCCKATFNEFGTYSWNPKSGEDEPIKENDHAMDEIRYFVRTNRLTLPARRGLL